MSEHPSPGPWRISYGTGGHDNFHRVLDRDGKLIFDFEVVYVPEHDHALANAKLCAAAPEMVLRIAELEAALHKIIEGEFDDLEPDDGGHDADKSARALARRALGDLVPLTLSERCYGAAT